ASRPRGYKLLRVNSELLDVYRRHLVRGTRRSTRRKTATNASEIFEVPAHSRTPPRSPEFGVPCPDSWPGSGWHRHWFRLCCCNNDAERSRQHRRNTAPALRGPTRDTSS